MERVFLMRALLMHILDHFCIIFTSIILLIQTTEDFIDCSHIYISWFLKTLLKYPFENVKVLIMPRAWGLHQFLHFVKQIINRNKIEMKCVEMRKVFFTINNDDYIMLLVLPRSFIALSCVPTRYHHSSSHHLSRLLSSFLPRFCIAHRLALHS